MTLAQQIYGKTIIRVDSHDITNGYCTHLGESVTALYFSDGSMVKLSITPSEYKSFVELEYKPSQQEDNGQ